MANKHQKNNKSAGRPAHCLVIPFPSHSYTDPMIQFSKRLQAKGVSVTFVLTHSFFKTLHKSSAFPFPVKIISDGHDTGGLNEASSLEVYLTKFQQIGSLALTQLLDKKKKLVFAVDCIVYAAILPWALDVAKKFGLVGAAFFSHSCAVNNLYHHAHEQGLLKIPQADRWTVDLNGLPLPEPVNMLRLMYYAFGFHSGLFDIHVNQFSNVGEADWLFCNTFLELERPVVETIEKKLSRFRTIGPHIPSMYLDKRLEYDKEYGAYTSKPGSRACIKWLKKQPDASVVYISIGSVYLGREQLEELAWGVKGSNRSFLWELEASEQAMLPKKFIKETCEQQGVGKVVLRCPQVEVLAQRSIGCFVTDCRWNTVLEAKSLGVPIVAIPQQNDQLCNKTHVTDVWKTGVYGGHWIVGKEVERCIREVMEGDRAREMKANAVEWRELARKAVDKDGSSDRNIDEFVASLIHSCR